jgi:hypothetical protein
MSWRDAEGGFPNSVRTAEAYDQNDPFAQCYTERTGDPFTSNQKWVKGTV